MGDVAATSYSRGRIRSAEEEAAYYLGMAKLARDRGRHELARHYAMLGRPDDAPAKGPRLAVVRLNGQ